MKAETPKPTYLKDYKVPTHLISDVELVFDIYDDRTTVTSKLSMQKNPASDEKGAPLVLNGESMKLEWVAIDGNRLSDGDYELTEKTLTLSPATETFTVEIQNTIDPANNTTLDGLYKSGDIFCSQCEPQGFRSITYFLDRSDVIPHKNRC